jgi:hypothetical protein
MQTVRKFMSLSVTDSLIFSKTERLKQQGNMSAIKWKENDYFTEKPDNNGWWKTSKTIRSTAPGCGMTKTAK